MLPALCFVSAPALAAEAPAFNQRPPGWECRWCPKPGPLNAAVTTGLGHASNSSGRFAQYRGVDDSGSHAVAAMEAQYRGDDAAYVDVKADDLGLGTRSLQLEGGRQGRYRASLNYDQFSSLGADSAQTPYAGSGSDQLTLPASWVPASSTSSMTALQTSLRDIRFEQERKRTQAGIAALASEHWQFSADFRHETKKGTKSLGGIIGSRFGNARSAILPQPVDYETNEIELKASYAQNGLQTEVGYLGSFFNNGNRSLTWQNAFVAAGQPNDTGQLALPPDNRSHQVFATIGYDLLPHTRLTTHLALGRMTQDESLLPFTINPTLQRALPRSSADAEVDTRLLDVKISSRPADGFRLMGEYKWNDRDNNTPRDRFSYVIADTSDAFTFRTNRPYSFRQELQRVEAGYDRLPGKTDLSLGLDRDRFERTFQEVETSNEETVWTKLKSSPHERIDLTLAYAHARRTVGDYQQLAETNPPQNPLMRKYYMADRERNRSSAGVTARLNPSWTLGANIALSDDDYADSVVGLKNAKDFAVTLDLSYSTGRNLNAYAFYTRQTIEADQAGSERFPTDPSPDWFAKSTDRFDTLGIGFKWTTLADRLELGADYVYADSDGRIRVDSRFIPTEPLPDFKTQRHTLDLFASYRLRRDLDLKLSYLYERFRSDDWTIDDVAADSISQVLNLGEESANYSDNIFQIAVEMRF